MVLFMIKPGYSEEIATRHQIYSMCVILYVGNTMHHFLEICIVDLMINISFVKCFLQDT